MIITLESGEDLRGDLIQSAIVRHDLIPIPVTLELNLKDSDKELSQKLDIAPSVPGTGIVVPTANISSPNKVKPILFLISLFLGLKINFRFLNI